METHPAGNALRHLRLASPPRGFLRRALALSLSMATLLPQPSALAKSADDSYVRANEEIARAQKELRERFASLGIIPVPSLVEAEKRIKALKAAKDGPKPPALDEAPVIELSAPNDPLNAWEELQKRHKSFSAFVEDLPRVRAEELPKRVRDLGASLGLEPAAAVALVPRYQELQGRVQTAGLLWSEPSYAGPNRIPMDSVQWARFLEMIPRVDAKIEKEYDARNEELLAIDALIKGGKPEEAARKLGDLLDGMRGGRGLLEDGFGTMAQAETLSLVQAAYGHLPKDHQAKLKENVLAVDRQLRDIAAKRIMVPDPKEGGGPAQPTSIETKFELAFYAALSALPLTSEWARERYFIVKTGEDIRLNPAVRFSDFKTVDPLDPARARLGIEIQLADGSRRYESADGLVIATSGDGRIVVTQDEARGAFEQKVDGVKVVWYARGEDGVTRGVFHGLEFEVGPDETMIFTEDGDKLLIARGFNAAGSPDVARWYEKTASLSGTVLANGWGQTMVYVEGGKVRRDVVLSKDAAKRIGAGEEFDYAGVAAHPGVQVSESAMRAYVKLIDAMRHASSDQWTDLDLYGMSIEGIANKEFGENYTKSFWIEIIRVRNGKLEIVLGESSNYDGEDHKHQGRRIVADFRDNTNMVAYEFTGDGPKDVFRWSFNPEMTKWERFRPNYNERDKVLFEHFETVEKVGGKWKQTSWKPFTTQVLTFWDDLKAIGGGALEGLGKGVGYILSPFELLVNDILGLLHAAIGGLGNLAWPDSEGFSLEQVHAVYTLRQSTIHEWVGLGMKGKDEIVEAYTGVLWNIYGVALDDRGQVRADRQPTRPKSYKILVDYLDGEILKMRRERWGELWEFHRDDPIDTMDRAYMAAGLFGYANLAAVYFSQGKDDFKKGNWVTGALNYAGGGFVIAGKAYLEGFGLGLAAAPLKSAAVASRTGLTAKEVETAFRTSEAIRRGAKGLELTKAQARAAELLKSYNKAEMALFMSPAAGQGAVNIAGMIDAWVKGDPEKAWANFDGLFSTTAGFGAMGIGLVQGRISAYTTRRAQLKAFEAELAKKVTEGPKNEGVKAENQAEASPKGADSQTVKPPETLDTRVLAEVETVLGRKLAEPQNQGMQKAFNRAANEMGLDPKSPTLNELDPLTARLVMERLLEGEGFTKAEIQKMRGMIDGEIARMRAEAEAAKQRAAAEKAKQPTRELDTSTRPLEHDAVARAEKVLTKKGDPPLKLTEQQAEVVRGVQEAMKVKKAQGAQMSEDVAREILKKAGFKDPQIDKMFAEKVFMDPRFTEMEAALPSQPGVGRAQVSDVVKDSIKDFEAHLADPKNAEFYKDTRHANPDMSRKLALAKYLREVQYGSEGKAIEAYINPDGVVMLTDSHHRGSALIDLMAMLDGVPPQLKPKLKVNIKGDYSGRPWGEFYMDLKGDKRKGQFTKQDRARFRERLGELREQYEKEGKPKKEAERLAADQAYEELFGKLPKSFKDLANDKMRSAIGNALFRSGLEGDLYYDYFEFKFYDYLSERGITFPKLVNRALARNPGWRPRADVPLEGDPVVLWEVRQALIKDLSAYAEDVFMDEGRLRDPAKIDKAKKFLETARRIHDAEGALLKKLREPLDDSVKYDADYLLEDVRRAKDKTKASLEFKRQYAELVSRGQGTLDTNAVDGLMEAWIKGLAESQALKASLKQ